MYEIDITVVVRHAETLDDVSVCAAALPIEVGDVTLGPPKKELGGLPHPAGTDTELPQPNATTT